MPFRTRIALSLAAALLAGLVSCHGRSPVQPSTPIPPGAPAGVGLEGQIVGALDDAGLAGLTVQVGSGTAAVSGPSGEFVVSGLQTGLQVATVSGPSVVTRQTGMTAPATGVRVQVIPAGFDLASFNQMLRPYGYLQRWTAAPRVVIVSRVLVFTSTGDDTFVARDEELSDAEIAGIADDLAGGFADLTGGALGGLAEVSTERPVPGQPVLVKRPGSIVVARHAGLNAATSYWGYGRWATVGGGEVVAGIVFLDRDFERSGSAYRRSLRVHELGHALGYMHVTLRGSVMNSSAAILPNDWDRQSVRIAFQRPPGNRTPDADPTSFSVNLRPPAGIRGAVTWGPWIY